MVKASSSQFSVLLLWIFGMAIFFISAEGQYPDALCCGSLIALFHFNFSKENRVNLDLLLFIKITSRAII